MSDDLSSADVLVAYPSPLREELAALNAASEGACAFCGYVRELCNAVTHDDRTTAQALIDLLFSGGAAAPGIVQGWPESFRQVKHLIEVVSDSVALRLPEADELYRNRRKKVHDRPEWFTDELESHLRALEKVFGHTRFGSAHEAVEHLLGRLVGIVRVADLSPDDLDLTELRWKVLKQCLSPICENDLASLGDNLRVERAAAGSRARDNLKHLATGDLSSNVEQMLGGRSESPAEKQTQESVSAAEANAEMMKLIKANPAMAECTKAQFAEAVATKTGKKCSPTTVFNTTMWKQLQQQEKGRGAVKRPATLEKGAIEAVAEANKLVHQMAGSEISKHQAEEYIESSKLPKDQRIGLLDQLELGQIDPASVPEIVQLAKEAVAEEKADVARHRRHRASS